MATQTIGEWTQAKLASFIRTIISTEPLPTQAFDEITIGKLTVTGESSGIGAVVPVGGIVDFGGDTAPPAWLLCDGALYNQGDYPELYNQIGTKFNVGGEGAGQFRVPNSKGRVSVGRDSGVSIFDTVGETGGATTVNIDHTHTDPSHSHGLNYNAIGPVAGGGAQFAIESGSISTDGAGGGQTGGMSANLTPSTLQPYLVLNKIIRASSV